MRVWMMTSILEDATLGVVRLVVKVKVGVGVMILAWNLENLGNEIRKYMDYGLHSQILAKFYGNFAHKNVYETLNSFYCHLENCGSGYAAAPIWEVLDDDDDHDCSNTLNFHHHHENSKKKDPDCYTWYDCYYYCYYSHYYPPHCYSLSAWV